MPRRIPDFPDSYAGWNIVSSFGSLVSVIATILFAYVIYDIFGKQGSATQIAISGRGGEVKNNPWSIPSHFDDEMKYDLIETYKQLEWAVASPAPEHCFTSKPKQS